MNRVPGIIYAISSAVAFGFVPVFAVIAYSGGTNAVTAVFLRFFLASVILLGILRYRKVKLAVSKKVFWRLAYLSIVGYAATCVTLFISYNYISIGLATILHFVYPAVVTVLSFFIFKEKLRPVKIISLLLSIAGVYILAGSGDASVSMGGVVLALVSGILYSIYTIELGREEIKTMDGLLLTFYVSLLSSASILLYGAATKNLMFSLQLSGLLAVLGLAVVCTVFGILVYCKAVQAIGPSDTAILSTFEPVTGVIMGIVMFGEKLDLTTAIGSSFIIISVLLFSYNRKAKVQEGKVSDMAQI
ncbi:MAG TPA: EamA family transporter [Clostridia bacterium]|nr:EamA family transporter [Clostridia bacterium]